MWIRQVTAQAFGPFKGESVDLAEGLTVIAGPNEAGKSSWHAAIYAGLCGMRRGKGRRLKDDESFAARHAPWDGGPWEVSAVVRLADGRTIELSHDLGSQTSSSARDLDLGHDVSAEIIHDGAPDGSRWLDLDRRAFQAVACVRQAQVLAVADHAETLQEHLQRAAATAGSDQTAAAALAALEAYQRDHVGTERANSTKPLMVAVRAVEAARQHHHEAAEAHEAWLESEADLGRLERKARLASERIRAARAVEARSEADSLAARVTEATELAERHPTEPTSLLGDDSLAGRISTALAAWEHRPVPSPLTGPSAAQLRAERDALPGPPQGDLEPHPDVLAARRTLADALSDHRAHQQHAPSPPTPVEAGGATESQLVELARDLEVVVPDVDQDLVATVDRLREASTSASGLGRRRGLAITAGSVAVAAAAAGGGALAAGMDVAAGAAGFAAATLAILVAVLAILIGRRPAPGVAAELQSAETRLILAQQRADEARQRRASAESAVDELGLDPEPASLRRLADQLRNAQASAEQHSRWQAEHERLATRVADAAGELYTVLGERGHQHDASLSEAESLLAAADAYEQACRQRQRIAAESSRRDTLDERIEARERAEVSYRDAQASSDQAHQQLAAVAADAGLIDSATAAGTDPDDLVRRLTEWRHQRAERRSQLAADHQEWNRLQVLLDGRRLQDWADDVRRARAKADELAAQVPAEALRDAEARSDLDVTELEADATRLDRELVAARRELEVTSASLVPVAETAEALEVAEAELARVRRLADTLETTRRYMADAQDRVHRDIAPVLAEKVRHRLSAVTGGRYHDVIVDPHSLAVQVRGPEGRWRDAALLSQGTAEQIYLLLRVAMAEILATGACPLLLDDVTVQSDDRRTAAILDVVHQISADHQVVLFTQEQPVIDWARRHLGDRDRLIELEAPGASWSRRLVERERRVLVVEQIGVHVHPHTQSHHSDQELAEAVRPLAREQHREETDQCHDVGGEDHQAVEDRDGEDPDEPQPHRQPVAVGELRIEVDRQRVTAGIGLGHRELERWIGLAQPQQVAVGPGLVADHQALQLGDGVGECAGEQDDEPADEREGAAQRVERPGDDQVGDRQQPVHQRPPVGHLRRCVQVERGARAHQAPPR
jgi:DNA repair protein SbcC/Rad50